MSMLLTENKGDEGEKNRPTMSKGSENPTTEEIDDKKHKEWLTRTAKKSNIEFQRNFDTLLNTLFDESEVEKKATFPDVEQELRQSTNSHDSATGKTTFSPESDQTPKTTSTVVEKLDYLTKKSGLDLPSLDDPPRPMSASPTDLKNLKRHDALPPLHSSSSSKGGKNMSLIKKQWRNPTRSSTHKKICSQCKTEISKKDGDFYYVNEDEQLVCDECAKHIGGKRRKKTKRKRRKKKKTRRKSKRKKKTRKRIKRKKRTKRK